MSVPQITANSDVWNSAQLALIKRTVGKACNDDEFNLFISACRNLNLDPLRRQIYAFVFNASNVKKRQMTLVTGIDGFRTIAARNGDYRPDEDEPLITYNKELVDKESNPLGIEKAVVKVNKLGPDGKWYKVAGVAYWDEFAPLSYAYSDYDYTDTGGTWPNGDPKQSKKLKPEAKKSLDTTGNWAKQPRLMIAKCAEAQALRRGWPDDLSNVYAAEEIDKARMIDITPSEAVAEANKEDRASRAGLKDTLAVDWMEGAGLEVVKLGDFADRAFDFIQKNVDEPGALQFWSDSNTVTLRHFWVSNPTDALEVKKRLEAALSRLPAPLPDEAQTAVNNLGAG